MKKKQREREREREKKKTKSNRRDRVCVGSERCLREIAQRVEVSFLRRRGSADQRLRTYVQKALD